MAKLTLNAAKLPKFEAINRNREIVVAENDGGKRFRPMATFKASVILRMRSLTQGHRLFWRITPFILIVAP